MLLAIDIGNTQIHLGLFPRKTGGALAPEASQSWRLSTRPQSTEDEYGAQVRGLLDQAGSRPEQVEGVVIASVVPPLDACFRHLTEKYFKKKALFIGPGVKTGVNILYDNPQEVGADRIVNAAAAHALVKGPCLVVDFGTATTFDCVNAKGEYMGGVIAPGLSLCAETLSQRTAKLPLVGHLPNVKKAMGRNTVDSLRSGLFFGYLGMVKELLARLQEEMPPKTSLLATGGLAALIAGHLPLIERVVPNLTLEGLRLIWERQGEA